MICERPNCCDGEGPTCSERYRHECEVRMVADLPDKEARREYIEAVARFRGRKASSAIIEGLREIARKRVQPAAQAAQSKE